ncbi:MAG: hypothetical protein ACRDJ9_20930 [Dehalococcoidia bacterium]
MATDGNELEQARAAAQTLIERLNADETYEQNLREDPVRALLAVGMPAELVGAALEELGASEEEVQGYILGYRGGDVHVSTLGIAAQPAQLCGWTCFLSNAFVTKCCDGVHTFR